MKATITVSYEAHSFDTSFPITEDTKEYQIADEAWRVALLFAETQAIALCRSVPQILEKLEYNYAVS